MGAILAEATQAGSQPHLSGAKNLADQPEIDGLTANLTAAYGTTLDLAVAALCELAKVSRLDRLDELEKAAILSAKKTTIEGASIETDAMMMRSGVTAVKMAFAMARESFSKHINGK